jgi:hypothetical protein
MKYQFQVDNRPAAPARDKWEDAAQDAVSDGYAVWVGGTSIKTVNGASIARIDSNG